jgi:hypothetical protein
MNQRHGVEILEIGENMIIITRDVWVQDAEEDSILEKYLDRPDWQAQEELNNA